MIYLVVFILTLYCIRFDNVKWNTSKNRWWNFERFVFIILVGLRYRVGGDSLAYIDTYEESLPFSVIFSKEIFHQFYQPLWYLIIAICRSISTDWLLFQLIHAVFVNTVVFWFVKKYASRPFLFLAFYFVMFYPYITMEILRESISICLFLLSVPSLLEKRYVKYYSFAIIAFGFHTSAIILFMVPIFIRYVKSSRFGLVLIGLLCFAYIMSSSRFVESIVTYINLDSVNSRFDLYNNNVRNINGTIMTIIMAVVPLLFVFKWKKAYDWELAFITIYTFALVMNIFIPVFSRFANYFIIPIYILLIKMFDDLFLIRGGNFTLVKATFVLYIGLLIMNKYNYYNQDMSEYNYGKPARFYELYYPYSSVFAPNDIQVRDNIFYKYRK